MAAAFGVRLDPRVDVSGELRVRLDFDPYRTGTIAELIDRWVPLSSLINNLNRAVGQHDAYPFVLTPAVVDKLGFIDGVVREAGAVQWTVPGPSGTDPDQYTLVIKRGIPKRSSGLAAIVRLPPIYRARPQ